MQLIKNTILKITPILPLALVSASLMGFIFWGCTTDSSPEPTVKILSPANGATVVGPNVLLKVAFTNFSFIGGLAKTTQVHEDPAVTGHIHVFLDKPAGLDANRYTNLTKADTVTLTGLSLGTHYIIVAGASGDHVDFESMVDSVKFTVTE